MLTTTLFTVDLIEQATKKSLRARAWLPFIKSKKLCVIKWIVSDERITENS